MTEANFIRDDAKAALDTMFESDTFWPGMSLVEMREAYTSFYLKLDLPRREVAVDRALRIPCPDEPLLLRMLDCRSDRQESPVLLFFHGGGFFLGDSEAFLPFLSEVTHFLDLPVISVDYRLAPENPWPAAPDDAEMAARWVAACSSELGFRVTGLVLAGDSAGGNLAVVTAMALRDRPAAAPVLVQAPIYPVVHVDPDFDFPSHQNRGSQYNVTHEQMKIFVDMLKADSTNWRASPILGEMKGLPPTAILAADLDPFLDHARALANALIKAGVPDVVYQEATGNIHGLIQLRKAIPSSVEDVSKFLSALKAMIASASKKLADRE